jgi:CO dehydrogenase maturation factor
MVRYNANYLHMVIGFLGKGGSGKSTLATGMVASLIRSHNSVLAIDADHNMDLAYNLGHTESGPYLGEAFQAIRAHCGIRDASAPNATAFINGDPGTRFSLSPLDEFTQNFSVKMQDNLRIMVAGPQHEGVLQGTHCSHSLASPLKLFLPLLTLNTQEAVVIDEKASVDAVSTGIPTGFDLAVIVAEPRSHSYKAAKDIGNLLNWYHVPHITVLNKVKSNEDTETFTAYFNELPYAIFQHSDDVIDGTAAGFTAIQQYASSLVHQDPYARLTRSMAKFKEQLAILT